MIGKPEVLPQAVKLVTDLVKQTDSNTADNNILTLLRLVISSEHPLLAPPQRTQEKNIAKLIQNRGHICLQ